VIVGGFLAGTLIGLAIRPLLDAYLLWSMQEQFRRRDVPNRMRDDANV
jgi:hypothetical protein